MSRAVENISEFVYTRYTRRDGECYTDIDGEDGANLKVCPQSCTGGVREKQLNTIRRYFPGEKRST